MQLQMGTAVESNQPYNFIFFSYRIAAAAATATTTTTTTIASTTATTIESRVA
jgi:hypothetical protein